MDESDPDDPPSSSRADPNDAPPPSASASSSSDGGPPEEFVEACRRMCKVKVHCGLQQTPCEHACIVEADTACGDLYVGFMACYGASLEDTSEVACGVPMECEPSYCRYLACRGGGSSGGCR